MSTNKINETYLRELGKSNFEIAQGDSDIRGWTVKNQHGKILGNVADLVFDTKAKKVRYMILDLAGNELYLQSRRVLMPLDLADLDEVHRNAVFPGSMSMELTSLPTYERDKLGRLEELVQNAFRSHYDGSGHPEDRDLYAGSSSMGTATTGSIPQPVASPHRSLASDVPAGRQTVVGVFEHSSQAEAAVDALILKGVKREDIDVSHRDSENAERENSISHFFQSLFSNDSEARSYSDAARTGSVVTVHVASRLEAEYAADVLDKNGAINMEDRVRSYRTENASYESSVRKFRSRIIDHGDSARRL